MRETEIRHTTGTVQLRADADGKRLGGYALKFNRLSQNLGGFVERIAAEANAGAQPRPAAQNASYVVLQVILKEKMWGTGSGNLTELEQAINAQARLGYRLHTITTSASGSKGLGGGDRIQATMVFEKLS